MGARPFDVVVVGAGVVGCSIAAHLLRRAPELRVLVIERSTAVAMGSSSRAAGGVRAQFGTAINIALSLASLREFETFADEVELRRYGYLFVTAGERGVAYLDEVVPLQARLGVPVRRLEPAQVAVRAPFLEVTDLRAAALSEGDGQLDPYSVVRHYETEARQRGAEFRFSAEVAQLDATGVTLVDGTVLSAGATVCATGHWLRRFFDLPVTAERHHLALTGPIDGLPEDLPMIVDLDTGLHFRREGRSLLVGWSDPETLACADDPNEAPSFDLGFLERLAEIALPRLAGLEDIGFDRRRSWAGWYAVTPDHHAILGRRDGTIVAAGFGGHGVMHAPAAGIAVAELVLDGDCASFDLHPLRPERFAENDLTLEPMIL